MKAIPHPIPYQGSKRQIASTIVSCFPGIVDRVIEPFAGSAAISIYAAYHRKAREFILNDINQPLMTLWDAIITQPDSLASRYELLWQLQQGRERSFYNLVRQRFNQTHRPYYFLYLLARCAKAAVRYNSNGEFNQSPDNRRKGRNPRAMRHDIMAVSSLLQQTKIMSLDYQSVLDLATAEDVVYLDPPYQGVCASTDPRYLQGIRFNGFVESLQKLNSRNIAYIVSYDGRTGSKRFGQSLPDFLQLRHIEIDAGRSSQATLLGRVANTYESLYLSPALLSKLDSDAVHNISKTTQLPLLTEPA